MVRGVTREEFSVRNVSGTVIADDASTRPRPSSAASRAGGLLISIVFVFIAVLRTEQAVEFLAKLQKLCAVFFRRDTRAEFLDSVTIGLVHAPEVLQ